MYSVQCACASTVYRLITFIAFYLCNPPSLSISGSGISHSINSILFFPLVCFQSVSYAPSLCNSFKGLAKVFCFIQVVRNGKLLHYFVVVFHHSPCRLYFLILYKTECSFVNTPNHPPSLDLLLHHSLSRSPSATVFFFCIIIFKT